MRRITAISCAFAICLGAVPALAAECANPAALGTSRTLAIDTSAHPRLGSMQYLETLPLARGEVVLTFDDGPLPPYTNRILDILKAECVKATYFLVGRMAQNFPELTRRIRDEGHTIGTHSLSHPLTFDRMPLEHARREIDGGIAQVGAALGEPAAVSPFFRVPGLLRTTEVESYIASRSLITWSADLVADDWRGITSTEVTQRALQRLQAKGRGILLLHDIQPATALALPGLLRGLKERGFRIVHVVPSGPNQPATATEPQQWAAKGGGRLVRAENTLHAGRPVPGRESLGVDYALGRRAVIGINKRKEPVVMAAALEMPSSASWPEYEKAVAATDLALFSPGIEEKDWPQAVQLTHWQAAQTVQWPVPLMRRGAEPRRAENPPVAARSRPQRTSTGKQVCRSSEFAARGIARCQKPGGHLLTLSQREKTG